MNEKSTPLHACKCQKEFHQPKMIALTGGPGAGKTAILEIARRKFCKHVAILPEVASIIFGGGFWRHETLAGKKAAQRAIYHVQREIETLVNEEKQAALALCDRGTLDSLAYWPNSEESFWKEIRSSKEEELSHYFAVIHLRTPSLEMGYNHQNPIRTETAKQAAEIDHRIISAWDGHPKRYFIEGQDDFLEKASRALDIIDRELPDCCS